VLLGLAFEPDLGRAAPLGDQVDLLVDVLFRIEGAGAGDFDDVYCATFSLFPLTRFHEKGDGS